MNYKLEYNYRRPAIDNLNVTQEYSAGKRILKSEVQYLQKRLEDFIGDYKLDAQLLGEGIATPISVVFKFRIINGDTLKAFKNLQVELEIYMEHSIEYKIDDYDSQIVLLSVNYQGRSIIGLRDIIDSDSFIDSESPLLIAAGVDVWGNYVYLDLLDNPHLLIDGVTGSGKTIFIDDIIMSLIYKSSPKDVRLLLADPKKVDLMPYEGIPHLLRPVITSETNLYDELVEIREEMDSRYYHFKKCNVKDIESYNKKAKEFTMPHIVILLDEYGEIMRKTDNKEYSKLQKLIDECVTQLSSRGRAAGIHLVIAMQTASRELLPGSIAANISMRVSFSNVIKVKGPNGSVRLLGRGDMMLLPSNGIGTRRAQAAFVTLDETKKVVNSVSTRNVKMAYEKVEVYNPKH